MEHETIQIRCDNCGLAERVVRVDGKVWVCVRCDKSVVISTEAELHNRNTGREIIQESQLSTNIPASLKKDAKPFCRIVYTEASPIEFTLKRENTYPLLDLGENGFGFYAKIEDPITKQKSGDKLTVEIDLPILESPIVIDVEIRWIQPIAAKKIARIGVQYCDKNEDLQKILDKIFNYILARPELWLGDD